MDQGNLMSETAQVHTQWKNNLLLKKIVTLRYSTRDNEFNRAINEEDIDFNIPGLPHSAVKQLHGASVRDLIQNIENHPHRHALQRDLQQHRQFNPFSKESKDMIRDVGNIELCELLDVETKAQCKVCLSYGDVGHRLLHVRALLARWNGGEQEIWQVHTLDSPLVSQLLHQERATPRAPLREGRRGSRVLHREFAQEEMQEEKISWYSRPVHPWWEIPRRTCLTLAAMKKYHEGEMITGPAFFISTFNFGKNNQDPAKDPQNSGKMALMNWFWLFFGVKKRIGGYERGEERKEKREERREVWITLQRAVMRCAVMCCGKFIYIYLLFRRLWPSTMFFFALM